MLIIILTPQVSSNFLNLNVYWREVLTKMQRLFVEIRQPFKPASSFTTRQYLDPHTNSIRTAAEHGSLPRQHDSVYEASSAWVNAVK